MNLAILLGLGPVSGRWVLGSMPWALNGEWVLPAEGVSVHPVGLEIQARHLHAAW